MILKNVYLTSQRYIYLSTKLIKFENRLRQPRKSFVQMFTTSREGYPSSKYEQYHENPCRAPFIGKHLLSAGSSYIRNYKERNVNVMPVRHFSFESIARSQSNFFTFMSESTPVHYAQMFFEYVHDASGLPWWASIILSTVIVRSFVALPLALHQNYILAKVQNLQHEMKDIAKQLQVEIAIAMKKFGWSKEQAQIHYRYSLKKQWEKLVVRDNCHPFKASLPIWFQMPMWICLSISLRNMAYMLPHHDATAEILFIELSRGGCLWFPNLTEIDHSFILPVFLGILNLAIVELQTMTKVKEPTKFQKNLTNFFRVLTLAMVPIASCVPTCMSLYWVSSSVCGLVQNLLVLSPRIRRWACIPKVKPMPSMSKTKSQKMQDSGDAKVKTITVEEQEYLQNHPYRYIASQFLNRIDRTVAKIGLGKGV